MRYEEFIEIREWLLKRAGSTNPYRVDKEKLKEGYASGTEEHLGQYVTASKVVENQTCVSYSYIIELWRADFRINRKRGDIRSPPYLLT